MGPTKGLTFSRGPKGCHVSLGVPGVTEEPFGKLVPDKPLQTDMQPRRSLGTRMVQKAAEKPFGSWGFGRQHILKGDNLGYSKSKQVNAS